MKHIAHPIIGDATHGKGVHNRMFAEHFGSQRMLLACMEMQITHPLTGAAITLTCPLAEDCQRGTRTGLGACAAGQLAARRLMCGRIRYNAAIVLES
jgi:tRNA pseudouridine65 synthase